MTAFTKRRKRAIALACAVSLSACSSAQSRYASAMYEINGHAYQCAWGRVYSLLSLSPTNIGHAFGRGELTESNRLDVLSELDDAIQLAKNDLASDPDASAPKRHDETAYIIPLAYIAKALVHGQFHQLTEAEADCWSAIKECEASVGQHVRNAAGSDPVPFGSYYVFFRREKVRREAFAILADLYRRAGEKDLEVLMQSQVRNSTVYLSSPVAHREEEFTRRIETADWVKDYLKTKSEVHSNMLEALIILLLVASAGAAGYTQANLQNQAMLTNDPATLENIKQQQDQLNQNMQDLAKNGAQLLEDVEKAHSDYAAGVDSDYRSRLAEALSSTYRLLSVSNEVRALPAFRKLQDQVSRFDDYVERHGFDIAAARQLAALRTSLDELTKQLQERRREKGGR